MFDHLEFRTGVFDYMGQMWTWLSGAGAVAPASPTLDTRFSITRILDKEIEV